MYRDSVSGMRGSARLVAAALLGIGCAEGAWADDFSAWKDSLRVQLNTTAAGADVSADVADFPVLVRLTANEVLFSDLKADGSDLRFADSAGNPLPFELERFDPSAKLAEAWVKVPSVKGNSSSQWFNMFWGNPSATSASSGPAVFPAAGNSGGAWHLGEDGGTAAGAYKDASSNANHGTGQAMTAASDAAGIIGTGSNFASASAQGVSVPNSASLHSDGALTVEAWVRSATQGAYRRFVGKPFTAAAAPWNEYSLESDVTGAKAVFSLTLGGIEAGAVGATVMANGTWYHVVGTYDGAQQKVYVNGVMETAVARTGAINDYGQALSIGKYALDGNSNFDGTLDEVRISRTARSADWIKLSHAGQKADQKLVAFKRVANQCQTRFAVPKDTAVDEGALMVLDADVGCAGTYGWMAVSGPAPRIVDPQVKSLQALMPRVAGAATVVYRFTADFGDTVRSGDVRVAIREAIPEPDFALPSLSAWSGAQPLEIKSAMANAAAIAASKEPVLRYVWTLSGTAVDTAQGAGVLTVSNPAGAGTLSIKLCVDNNGPEICKQASVEISPSTGIRPAARLRTWEQGKGRPRDARGRLIRERLLDVD